MLELRRQAHRRRHRRGAALRAEAAMVAVALAGAAARYVDSPPVAVVSGLAAIAGLLVALNWALEAARPEVPWVQVVFDQPLQPPEPWRGLGYGEVLQLYWADLERLAREAGVRRLGQFAGAIRAGSAQFEPALGLETVDALLRAPSLDAELRQALEALRARLALAQARGARFCVMSGGGWSGAIESDLHLYWR